MIPDKVQMKELDEAQSSELDVTVPFLNFSNKAHSFESFSDVNPRKMIEDTVRKCQALTRVSECSKAFNSNTDNL